MQTLSSQNVMSNHSGFTHSLWMEERLPFFPPLEKHLSADVCIVGAGIAGLTCAYTLLKRGLSVVVVDQAMIGGGQTARTTAHVSWVLDDRFHELEKYFGENGSRLAAESHADAIEYIEKIVAEEKIECDWKRVAGYLFRASEDPKDLLEKEYTAIKKTGKSVEKISKAPFSSFDTGPCLYFPDQAQMHMLKYLKGLVAAVEKYGGKIFCNTHVKHVKEEGNVCVTETQSGNSIRSSSIIMGTCTPVNNRVVIHTKQAAYCTYVIAATVPKGAVPEGLFWDTGDPYHYLRTQDHEKDPQLQWLIVGGEDHRTGEEKKIQSRYAHLEKWMRKRFPMILDIGYRWSGQVFEPVDCLAFIGRNPGNQNIYIVTGDSGNGLTHATIAGQLIPDLITGQSNPWQSLYAPDRKTLRAFSEFIHENANTVAQYRDWLTPGETKQIDQLPIEEGMILRKGLKKIAVYKDAQNTTHMHSAFCPHLGGCVRWNSSEKTWDCPCHGSRFSGCGEVLTGPSISSLPPCKKE